MWISCVLDNELCETGLLFGIACTCSVVSLVISVVVCRMTPEFSKWQLKQIGSHLSQHFTLHVLTSFVGLSYFSSSAYERLCGFSNSLLESVQQWLSHHGRSDWPKLWLNKPAKILTTCHSCSTIIIIKLGIILFYIIYYILIQYSILHGNDSIKDNCILFKCNI